MKIRIIKKNESHLNEYLEHLNQDRTKACRWTFFFLAFTFFRLCSVQAANGTGTVVAWGDLIVASPQPSGVKIVGVSAGGEHSMILREDGNVIAWGKNTDGRSRVPSGLHGVTSVSAGLRHCLALKSDGTVVAWGEDTSGQSSVPSGLSGIVQIAAGTRHSLALKGDGNVVAWGGFASQGEAIVPVELSGVVAIAAGEESSLVLKSNGTVVSWGSTSPVPSGLVGVTAIAAGRYHNLALKNDSTVVGWGNNSAGQINVPPGLSGVVAIAAGGEHSLALKSDGTVVAWGGNSNGQTTIPTGTSGISAIAAGLSHSLAVKSDGTVVAWGEDDYGQVTVPGAMNDMKQLSAGDGFITALRANGTVAAWGSGSLQITVPPGLHGVVAIASGYYHTLALRSDRSGVAWGLNNHGQTDTLGGVVVAGGGHHSLAINSAGMVGARGYNSQGQATVPSGLTRDAVGVAAGRSHSLALKNDGTVIAWGYDYFGQATVPAGLANVTAIAAGEHHSLALLSDGSVVAWGDNNHGQSAVPPGLSGVMAIAAGFRHSLALKNDGTVVGWGRNDKGQVTIPSGLTRVFAIAAGGNHSLALVAPPEVPLITSGTTAAATVGQPFSYQITADNSPTSFGATGLPTGLSIDTSTGHISGTPTGSGSFSVTLSASNSGGTGTRNLDLAISSAPVPPAITTQPQGQAVSAGADVTLTASATGTAPFGYQWKKDGTDVSGATESSLILTNVQAGSGGSYTVVITNSAGSATSTPAVLTVNAPPSASTNQVLTLDGNGDFVTIPDSPAMRLASGDFTISAWIYFRSIEPGNSAILTKRTEGSRMGYLLYLGGQTGEHNRLGFMASGGSDARVLSTSILQAETWYHVAVSFSSADGLATVFVNGTPEATSPVFQPLETSSAVLVGRDSITGRYFFDGHLDELRVWNTTRSQQQIVSSMRSRLSDNDPDLVAYWKFDDGTASDVTGHGHDGVFAGNATTVEPSIDPLRSPVYAAPPDPNHVLTLDGSGDFVTISSAVELQNPNAFTIEAWLYPVHNAANHNAHFVNKGDGHSGDTSRTYEVIFLPNGELVFHVFFPGTHVSPRVEVQPEQWVHFAGTFDSVAGEVGVYTNGVKAVSVTRTGVTDLQGLTLRQSTLPLMFGYLQPHAGTFATGQMDEVRVWTKVRTTNEIAHAMFTRLNGNEPGLAGYWTFDDGTATDVTGHGHDGVLSGNAGTIPLVYNPLHGPFLRVEPSGDHILVAWPTTAATFRLQSVHSLSPPTQWIQVPANIETNGGELRFVAPRTTNSMFYRLVRP